MSIYDINGRIVGSEENSYPMIYTDNYADNFDCLISDDFKVANSRLRYTNCTVTNGELPCTSYCRVSIPEGAILNDSRISIKFRYTGDAIIALFFGGVCAYVNTTLKIVNVASGYYQKESAGVDFTSGTQNIEFDFVQGQEYVFTMERNFWDVTGTIKDITGCTENSKTYKIGLQNYAVIASNNMLPAGFAVHGGSCVVNGLSYWIPFAGKHLKALIIGDSISEGVTSGKTDATCWSRRMIFEHFHGNGMTCCNGGISPIDGVANFTKLVDIGYTFDLVISYLCTNDTCTDAQINAKKQAYQGYVDAINATGAKCIWCMFPEYTEGQTSTSRVNLRTVMQSLTGLEALIDFGEVVDPNDNVHVSLTGQTSMFYLANNMLDLKGI